MVASFTSTAERRGIRSSICAWILESQSIPTPTMNDNNPPTTQRKKSPSNFSTIPAILRGMRLMVKERV